MRWKSLYIDASTLIDAIEAAGYIAAPDTVAHAVAMRKAEFRVAIWRLFVSVFCAMEIMMLATLAYVSAGGDLATDQQRLLDLAAWMLTLPILVFSAKPFFAGAWQSLRQRRIGMDVPVALGIGVAFVASTIVTFLPAASGDVYFDSLSMFVSSLLAGRLLEMQIRHKVKRLLEEATERVPASVTRLTANGGSEVVNLARLRSGDRVRVRVPVGEGFPADGTLIGGTCETDESLTTGEFRGVSKEIGDIGVPYGPASRRCWPRSIAGRARLYGACWVWLRPLGSHGASSIRRARSGPRSPCWSSRVPVRCWPLRRRWVARDCFCVGSMRSRGWRKSTRCFSTRPGR